MNRADQSTEDPGRIRLDPEPQTERTRIVPPIEVETDAPDEQQTGPSVAEDLAEMAKEITGEEQQDAEKREADRKFLEKYGELDLMRLVTEGSVQHEVEVFKGFTVVIRTLTEDEDQEILKKVETLVGSNWYMGDMSSRITLSYAIVKVNGVEFGDNQENRLEKIGKWGKVLKLALFQEFRGLNKAVALKMEGRSGNLLERLLIGQDLI
jgi:hypothetical protein